MERDPVCGMAVDPATAQNRTEHARKTYYFCGARCLAKFVAEPQKYLTPASETSGRHEHRKTSAPPSGDADVIYTCPMHPQIRQQGPGACPICGMALEPLHVGVADVANLELIDMTRRFWIGLMLTLPVLGLEMSGHMLGAAPLVSMSQSIWIQFALSTPVVLWAGWPFFESGWASLVHRSLNMFTLIALGTGAAYLFSVVETLAPQLFPATLRMGGLVPVYFEAAAVITVLVLLGQVLELRAREQTGGAIRALLKLTPPRARRLRWGS